jgi:hypothetical protein
VVTCMPRLGCAFIVDFLLDSSFTWWPAGYAGRTTLVTL